MPADRAHQPRRAAPPRRPLWWRTRGGLAGLVVGVLLLSVTTAALQWHTIPPGRGDPALALATARAGQDADRPRRPERAAAPAAVVPTPTASPTDPGFPVPVGERMRAQIPAQARQLVLAVGQDRNADQTTVYLLTRADDGPWRVGAEWPAHNGLHGWTDDHREGDLRSPVGVFGLTDAGGYRPNPGTRLPYSQANHYDVEGQGVQGESLRGAFDYVVAINYNRVEGSSPADPRRPLGEDRGGGIWLHVDHGGATRSCISLPEPAMRALLTALDPAAHPVILMGDRASLTG